MKSNGNYQAFLEKKTQLGGEHGFAPVFIPDFLFDFQKFFIDWALRGGRRAIYADCGLGKTPMALVWAENVVRRTNRRVLILTPLAVGMQFVQEGEKFAIECKQVRDGQLDGCKIVVTNYEQLHQFNASDFIGVVADESSILKHYSGKRQREVTRFMSKMPYRLLTTATPAPNDYTELGTSSEAIGELSYTDMLETFFREMDWDERRQMLFEGHYSRHLSLRALESMARWRFKGHARLPFWRWVASWARACRKPSDLDPTFNDQEFVLPPLLEHDSIIKTTHPPEGMMFAMPAITMRQELAERRAMLKERCEKAGELSNHKKPVLIWCHLNSESILLHKIIGKDSVEVCGANTDEAKEERIRAFLNGEARILITKPKIAGLGLNLQHCDHVITFATHSFESYYQSIRRCWRYGQKSPVTVDTIWTEGETRIQKNLRRKCAAASEMFDQIVKHMQDALNVQADRSMQNIKLPRWLCSIQ